ncbi:MAG: hypothetical protein MUF10_03765 [Thermoanaerobaculaceae bacterium]|nr:hypothetical protein [Thermoanaerobaculaceae bacterium]
MVDALLAGGKSLVGARSGGSQPGVGFEVARRSGLRSWCGSARPASWWRLVRVARGLARR